MPSCPKCGSREIATETYDYGVDRETGYHDAGTMGICLACGCKADIEDFGEENHGADFQRRV